MVPLGKEDINEVQNQRTMAPVDRNILLAKLHHNTGLSTITMTARLGVKPTSRSGGREGRVGRNRQRSLFEIMEEIERKESSDCLSSDVLSSDTNCDSNVDSSALVKRSGKEDERELSNQQNQADVESQRRAERERVKASLLTAERINRLMRKHSDDSALTVVNLPLKTRMQPDHFVDYVCVLTKGIDRMLLVRGSGKEVVTSFA